MATLRSKAAHAVLAALLATAASACAPSPENAEAATADANGVQPTKAGDALYAWEGTIRAEKIYEGASRVSGFPDTGDYTHTVEYRVRLEETANGEMRPVQLDYVVTSALELNKIAWCYAAPHDLRVSGTARGRLTANGTADAASLTNSRGASRLHGSVDRSSEPTLRGLLKGTTDINHAPEYFEERLVKHFYSISVNLDDDDPRLFAGISHQEGSDWTADDKRRPNWFLGSAGEVLYLEIKGVLSSLDQEEVRGSVKFFGNTTVGYDRCDAHTKTNTDWVFRRTKLPPSPPPGDPERGERSAPGGVASADLVLSAESPVQTIRAGASTEQRLDVTNNGPAVAIGAMAVVNVPSTVGVVSVQSTRGSCQLMQSIICDIGVLENKASARIVFVMTANALGTASYTTTVVSATPDPDLSNNNLKLAIQAIK